MPDEPMSADDLLALARRLGIKIWPQEEAGAGYVILDEDLQRRSDGALDPEVEAFERAFSERELEIRTLIDADPLWLYAEGMAIWPEASSESDEDGDDQSAGDRGGVVGPAAVELTYVGRAILDLLAEVAERHPDGWLSLEWIANLAGLRRREVRRALPGLVADGLVEQIATPMQGWTDYRYRRPRPLDGRT